ncbi:hypothetical protein [Haloplanus halophilus]|uniref:hypothetical protein n=1 Tax=Haloplanus halophilus TaxID=2949993 RepID=UPI002040C74D|nr:hypothetical protein [Haloplanus sp. GDY1]
MSLDDVRAAAIDRALVGDDPETALALAGVVDVAGTAGAESVDESFAATLLAVRALATGPDRALDEDAWEPGTDPEPFVVAGAAAAVRSRDLPLDRAADLANCSATTLDAALDRRKKE